MQKFRLRKELKKSYEPPKPLRKEEFIRNLNYPKARAFEVLKVQAGYIPKYVWAISVLPILFIFIMEGLPGYYFDRYFLIGCLSVFMPMLAVVAVSESFRSGVYGMAELEMAAKYNLPQILLMRMGILGGLDLCLALAAIYFVVRTGETGILQASVYVLVPWECTCLLSFQVEKYRKGKESVWCKILCGILVCMAEVLFYNYRMTIYDRNKMPFWALVFCFFSVLLARQVWRIRQETEDWKWNLYLTE